MVGDPGEQADAFVGQQEGRSGVRVDDRPLGGHPAVVDDPQVQLAGVIAGDRLHLRLAVVKEAEEPDGHRVAADEVPHLGDPRLAEGEVAPVQVRPGRELLVGHRLDATAHEEERTGQNPEDGRPARHDDDP